MIVIGDEREAAEAGLLPCEFLPCQAQVEMNFSSGDSSGVILPYCVASPPGSVVGLQLCSYYQSSALPPVGYFAHPAFHRRYYRPGKHGHSVFGTRRSVARCGDEVR